MHAGPFANVAHGNSSILADLIGIKTADYLMTESGFGADIGAEKFFNIKCRYSGLKPDACVIVATIRALKSHSGKYKIAAGKALPPEMLENNVDDVVAGADGQAAACPPKLNGRRPRVGVSQGSAIPGGTTYRCG